MSIQTLVAVKDSKIAATIDNWNLPDRIHLQDGWMNKIRTNFGIDTVFHVVSDADRTGVEARNLYPNWIWDEDNQCGIEPEEYSQAREEMESIILEEQSTKESIDIDSITSIVDGSFAGTTEQALQALANALKYFIIKDVQKPEVITAASSVLSGGLKKP